MDSIFIQPHDPPLFISISPIFNDFQVFTGNDKKHMVYELLIINGTKNPVRILAVEIFGYKCKHYSFEYIISGKDLAKDFTTISTANTTLPEDPLLQPNETGILYIFLNFNCKIPNFIEHNIIVQTENDPSTIQSIILDPIKLDKCQPIIVSPPLKGNNWYAEGAINNIAPHRRTIFILNGQIKIPERTAVDFLKYGPNGLYDGDPLINSNYYSYGKNIYSPVNGKVIGLMDGIPENIPTKSMKDPVTSKNIAGNYVLIKIDEDHYVFLAHMIPGSLKVQIGEDVQIGKKLGLVGNSGQSLVPHLHFQISNKPHRIGNYKEPSPINAQGIPWLFDKFILNEFIPIGISILGPFLPENVEIISKKIIKNQMLLDNNLVNFK